MFVALKANPRKRVFVKVKWQARLNVALFESARMRIHVAIDRRTCFFPWIQAKAAGREQQ